MHVALLSANPASANPYIRLFQQGLEAAGAAVTLYTDPGPTGLPAAAGQADVVHLHWLELWGRPPYRSLAGLQRWGLFGRGLRRWLEPALNSETLFSRRRQRFLDRFLAALANYKARGGRLVYTAHNLGQHEGEAEAVELAGLRRLLALADAVHVHGPSIAMAVRPLLVAEGGGIAPLSPSIAVIPHGHYLDAYPNHVSRDAARQRLGLPAHAFVFLALGLIRPYKGLEELLAAFRAVEGEHVRLAIAGQPRPRSYADRLAADAADRRILWHPHFIADDEVQVWMNAADVAVLPYRRVTTSGAALLAFSFGKPIVAPALPGFLELTGGDPALGLLYPPQDPDGLRRALEAASQVDWQPCRDAILAWVRRFDWLNIGRQLVALYSAIGHR
ncbi:MAG: glycosyltransferase [Caldilineales bacterium]|nr:glycosyltransferase [Caldilineales bacterium]MDW8319503.1 glycosyltransferase [Anaerolineae bacterium]